MQCSFFGQHLLALQAYGALLDCVFIVNIHIDPVHWFFCKEPCFLNPHVVVVHLVQYLLLQCKRYNYHLSFIAAPLIIARSYLSGQDLHKLSSISSLFEAFLFLCMSIICSSVSSLTAALISSLDKQIGKSTTVLIVYMLILISAGPCFLCGCAGTSYLLYTGLEQIFKVYACCAGGCAAWCIVATVTGLHCPCLPLPLMACGVWLYTLPWWRSSGEISLIYVACQGLPILCCYSAILCWISFCLWMQWDTVMCCLESNLTHSSCHHLPVTGHHPGQNQRHLSPGVRAMVHHKTSYMHLAW